MANYHGVEWYHDPLSLLAATRGGKAALWTGFDYPGFSRNNPGEATTASLAHWDCVMSDRVAKAAWLGDGVAIERPDLPTTGLGSGGRCAICAGE